MVDSPVDDDPVDGNRIAGSGSATMPGWSGRRCSRCRFSSTTRADEGESPNSNSVARAPALLPSLDVASDEERKMSAVTESK